MNEPPKSKDEIMEQQKKEIERLKRIVASLRLALADEEQLEEEDVKK